MTHQQIEGTDLDGEGGAATRSRALSGGMTKVAANIDNALTSLSRRISSASSSDRGASGLTRRGSVKRDVIKIRTNSEVSFDEESDSDDTMALEDESNIDSI